MRVESPAPVENDDQPGSEVRPKRSFGQLTGWEDVIFELEDLPDEESWETSLFSTRS